MISSVRSFGAPVIEPAGNAARTQSIASASSRRRPRTTVTIWWTVACDSTTISRGTSTVPSRETPPEVVAHEVGDHEVLGAGLLVAAQLGRRGRRPPSARPAAPRCP